MDIRRIDDSLAVSPQIRPEDVAELARLGFRTLIANRPEHEEPGQPAMADLQREAEAHGMKWLYLPVESGHITDADVDAFAPEFEQAEKPVFAFCRSGTRSTILWALSTARYRPLEPIIGQAAQAGYDLRGLIPRLKQQAAAHQG